MVTLPGGQRAGIDILVISLPESSTKQSGMMVVRMNDF